jgi:hypothetical protein
MQTLWIAYSILGALGIQLAWTAEIYGKEANDDVLHDLTSTTSDDDVTARAFNVLREFQPGTHREDFVSQSALEDELGRGHRRTWQATSPHALESRGRGWALNGLPHIINRSLLAQTGEPPAL